MHLFHKWTKWEEYDENVILIPGILERRSKTYRGIQKWQKRQCVVCGKTQRTEV